MRRQQICQTRFYAYNEFTFVRDSDKEEINYKKHGITFKTAARVFEDELRIELTDPKHSKDEDRYITIGLVHKIITHYHIYFVTYEICN